jgi:putative hydrolase of the HAD superfamily
MAGPARGIAAAVIRAILFDLGNTIVPFDFRRGYARMEGLCPWPAAEIPRRLGRTDLVQRFETGALQPEEFFRRLCAELDLRMTYAEFCDVWSSIFLPDTLIPESLVASLARRYRLVLLSNTNAIHFTMVRASYPLLGHFHDYVLSYVVGAAKPSPRIYREAIARAGCAAGECFFVDDLAACAEGARSEGIDAVRFESLEQLERDLRARGIEW